MPSTAASTASTPLIAQWPARIRKGGLWTHQFGHAIDLMATAVDAAGAQYPVTHIGRPVAPLEGRSLVPVFDGQTRDPNRAVFWEHAGNRALRQGKWKLVSRYPDRWELDDMEADRSEMNDLAAKMPGQAEELEKLYNQWAARAGAFPPDQLGRKGKKGQLWSLRRKQGDRDAASGALNLRFFARGDMPAVSSPNRASMIMGAGPERHGVSSNQWRPDKF